MNLSHPSHRASFNGVRPLALTKKQAVSALGSSKLVARMLWASRHANDPWLIVVRPGRDLLIDTESVEAAYERLLRGEQPPLMPCERRKNRPCRYELEAAREGKLVRGGTRLHEPRCVFLAIAFVRFASGMIEHSTQLHP